MRKLHNRANTYLKPLAALLLLPIIFSGNLTPASAKEDAGDSPPSVILFIGDGMGEAHQMAARWESVGPDGSLNMDGLTVSGWSKTNNSAGGVTDSAAAATAMATGQKTSNQHVSIGINGEVLPTIVEYTQRKGMAVGLVTNVQMAHATPAAFASHVPSRYSYKEIARQMLEHKVNVLMAGGEDDFIPNSETGCYPNLGHRSDGRNLITEAVADGYKNVCDGTSLGAVNLENTTHLLGLFADDGLIRPYSPTLETMTSAAITILSQDPEGFFLMVEGGQIDWASHSNDAANVIGDVLGFDAAVAVGLNYAATNSNTLIIVTADHETGGMSVSWDSSGDVGEDGPFYTPDGAPFFVNWSGTAHTNVDVPVSASGYLEENLSGSYENTHIYYAMRNVIGWDIFLTLIFK